MVATLSWPGLSGPSLSAHAATDGSDQPGHDEEATSGPVLTPMRTSRAMTGRERPFPVHRLFLTPMVAAPSAEAQGPERHGKFPVRRGDMAQQPFLEKPQGQAQ